MIHIGFYILLNVPGGVGLRGRMSEVGRQVEALFESLLAEAFS
jgi:hypothetical protein